MDTTMDLGPEDLLYKPVVDKDGDTVGQVVNLTQNGSGNFDIVGVRVDEEAAVRINRGRVRPVSQLFIDVLLIESVDRIVKLRKRIEEL